MLIHACPCGYYGDPLHECTCNQGSIDRYLSKISNPLLDRIDIHVEVAPVDYRDLTEETMEETSLQIKERVEIAREIQNKRYKDSKIFSNSQISNKDIEKHCKLKTSSEQIMSMAFEKYKFSARTYNKLLKVSRTIADLDGKASIEDSHILEAIRYRTLDNKYWG